MSGKTKIKGIRLSDGTVRGIIFAKNLQDGLEKISRIDDETMRRMIIEDVVDDLTPDNRAEITAASDPTKEPMQVIADQIYSLMRRNALGNYQTPTSLLICLDKARKRVYVATDMTYEPTKAP